MARKSTAIARTRRSSSNRSSGALVKELERSLSKETRQANKIARLDNEIETIHKGKIGEQLINTASTAGGAFIGGAAEGAVNLVIKDEKKAKAVANTLNGTAGGLISVLGITTLKNRKASEAVKGIGDGMLSKPFSDLGNTAINAVFGKKNEDNDDDDFSDDND